MFTGIVQGLVPVVGLEKDGGLSHVCLDMTNLTQDLQLGASVAVNGTCLTVTHIEGALVHFDVIPETLRTSNLYLLKLDDEVNVERSFRVGDEIGGHTVSGHVTATAALVANECEDNDRILTFQMDEQWLRYVFHKGFIALDGASLTVSSLDRDLHTFSVSLIPETIARTTLGSISVGGLVNVEVDTQTMAIVETVERVLADRATSSL